MSPILKLILTFSFVAPYACFDSVRVGAIGLSVAIAGIIALDMKNSF